MRFVSTQGQAAPTTFLEALRAGLAPDGGLFMPETIPALPERCWKSGMGLSLADRAREMLAPFVGSDLPLQALDEITKSALDSRRPFMVYFGDGPAFAMIGQITLAAERAAIFQTSDRALVEHLAFELQRELEIVLSV